MVLLQLRQRGGSVKLLVLPSTNLSLSNFHTMSTRYVSIQPESGCLRQGLRVPHARGNSDEYSRQQTELPCKGRNSASKNVTFKRCHHAQTLAHALISPCHESFVLADSSRLFVVEPYAHNPSSYTTSTNIRDPKSSCYPYVHKQSNSWPFSWPFDR